MRFSKYEGAGNDFILIDDRALSFDCSLVSSLCHRQKGIGADGVILLQEDKKDLIRMRIFNSDGSEAESCGNGLRCFARFADELGLPIKNIAIHDKIVSASFVGDKVALSLGEPKNLCLNLPLAIGSEKLQLHTVNTGVPHAVLFVENLETIDVMTLGSKLRRHPAFLPNGTNVNFAKLTSQNTLHIRTFERGVEAETLACGTGAAASGVIASALFDLPSPVHILCKGGDLEIHFTSKDFSDLKLIGPARKIFSGIIE